ncbi:hypothetical protein S7335_1515 [Synechococcus sp. PCC 7335]|uniref:hypothetical protein n=1 Tax=Synechococcus sp. (strain ATCC 29403 / PCC 7335) TaxID=91464 RepID=UPI00017EDCC1|nr:hypothetical protein [Synechococcus sp. PCC 7335]EDX83818.1 hypothetical protein S7335_1515 [Synechococcus sp. PCC 7335]
MTTSAISEQPQKASERKERSQPTLWAIAGIFFILGAAASTFTIWQLHKLYRASIAPPISVEGTLQAQYNLDETVVHPAPAGYYIEGTGVGRIYLQGLPLQSYVGESIVATGSVEGICGPKSIPCYPMLSLREIGYPPAEE